ncbi:cadherin-like protein 26 isoform X2 [Xyrauchen texanus]|uniref:cadherin-like protein 26 isoform X2 n=1 Tax=Xyrauchen texanus TaxID=154827 RepID=UPI0022425A5F|nr:cadherin-like protein 26 isoform X2 [Xyrauchen texanus]
MRTLHDTVFLTLFIWTLCSLADTRKIRQKRAWIIDSFSIEEENPGPFPYKLGMIELEKTYLVNFELKGEGVDQEPKNILLINKETGVINVYGKVDYEAIDVTKKLKLVFEARNRSNNLVDTRLGVQITILDINDHPPVFQSEKYEVSVDESHAQDKEFLTVLAADKDDINTKNGTFSYTIKSVMPKTDNVEFYIRQHEQSGTVYFKGCLDYQKAQKYEILVEAKDHGEKIQLSSTSTLIVNILDKNNHLPEFSGKTGPGKVKERETGIEVLRLQVTDKDKPGSNAWKAKYTIIGDPKQFFKIETDPVTNEGILTIVKPMDYEEQRYQNLSIRVQNEAPYFYCKVTKRVPNAKWELDNFNENSATSFPNLYNIIPVSINVEDINDPPVFIPPVKEIVVMENIEVGTFLTTFTAKDLDGSHINTFKFVKGEDIGEWITVDAKTARVSTAKILDRESPILVNSTYRATLYAVDDGVPPLTGTGTLIIHINDQNDNVPMLQEKHINMCLSKEHTMANITAVDLDLPPYSSPFYFELLGDVKGKWRTDPTHGTTVNLVKESSVYSGHHRLQIRILDQQGFYAMQNLSVTVCDCSTVPNCHLRMVLKVQMHAGATLIVVIAVLTLIVMFLMTLLISCKAEKNMILMDEGLGHLITKNTENPGTDCMVPANVGVHQTDSSKERNNTNMSNQNVQVVYKGQQAVLQVPKQVYTGQTFQRSIYRSSTRRSYRELKNVQGSSMRSSFRSFSSNNGNIPYMREKLSFLINQQLLAVQTHDEELNVYEPHCYADEGTFTASAELDAISIPENDFHPNMLRNLDNKFNNLANISRPDLMEK